MAFGLTTRGARKLCSRGATPCGGTAADTVVDIRPQGLAASTKGMAAAQQQHTKQQVWVCAPTPGGAPRAQAGRKRGLHCSSPTVTARAMTLSTVSDNCEVVGGAVVHVFAVLEVDALQRYHRSHQLPRPLALLRVIPLQARRE